MIEESTRLHDKYQIEFKFTYPLRTDCPRTNYEVEAFFFIPNNLGITPESYHKEDFYHDSQNYIRLKTPSLLLRNIIDGEANPIAKLKAAIQQLSDENHPDKEKEYERQLKLFCTILKSAVRDKIAFIKQQENLRDVDHLVRNFLDHTQEIAQLFRSLRDFVNVPTNSQKQISLFLFADEYLSLVMDKYRYQLLEYLEQCPDFKKREIYCQEILKALKHELKYRAKNNYPSIPRGDTDNEVFLFRISALKKLMGSILFLHTHTDREGKLAEHLLYGTAAALAMAFATAIAFISKSVFEDLTLSFFAILVIAYVFKDRIKEIGKTCFSRLISKYCYDHKTVVINNLNTKLGICRENMEFIPEKSLPAQVKERRNRDFITALDNGVTGEQVIVYRKKIKLLSNRIEMLFSDFKIDGINDIFRFNIQRFLAKMDNPEKVLFVPEKGSYSQVMSSRVYHINVIIRYTIENRDLYHRYRIILNRNGLKRIEEVTATPNP